MTAGYGRGYRADMIIKDERQLTETVTMNGAPATPQVRTRCLSAEQAGDTAATFTPEYRNASSNCDRSEFQSTASKLKWRMLCKGQMDMDVAAVFDFDSPRHYTAIILTRGYMAGALTNDVKTELEGEHLGACE